MNVLSYLVGVGSQLLGLPCTHFARNVWCREQRRLLRVPGHSVVWVRGDALSWAEWGARRGFFEVKQMDGLYYLRVVGAAIV